MPFACRVVGDVGVVGRRLRALVVAVSLVVVVVVAGASPAGAHPLGNFTTNRYARVEVGARSVRIHYVLDEAELVAFRERRALAVGEERFATDRAREIAEGLRLTVGGRAVLLEIADHRLEQPPGQGGLTTLRLEVLYIGALTEVSGATNVRFEDTNQPERLGWREIVARPIGGSRITSSDVPEADRTAELTRYPEDPSVAPLDVRAAEITYLPGTGEEGPARLGAAPTGGGVGGDRFVGLLGRTTSSPLAILSALALAVGFGGVHALGPGHGKTVMAAYLVSTRGRRRDALYLGAIVSLMHTASVLVLALLLATVGRRLEADRLYPGLTLVAGLVVAVVGLRLFLRRWRNRTPGGSHGSGHAGDHRRHDAHDDHTHDDHAHGGDTHHDHDHAHEHGHDDHGHGHADEHGHDHGGRTHSHALPADVSPLSRAGLVALGTSGGLFPSPSAVVVLVGAFALGRAPLGLALIGAFSIGLALVLVAVGLLLVAGRDRMARSSFALRVRWLPLAGAAAIVVLGVVLVVQGLLGLR